MFNRCQVYNHTKCDINQSDVIHMASAVRCRSRANKIENGLLLLLLPLAVAIVGPVFAAGYFPCSPSSHMPLFPRPCLSAVACLRCCPWQVASDERQEPTTSIATVVTIAVVVDALVVVVVSIAVCWLFGH